MNLITLSNVSVSYDGYQALEEACLNIADDDFIGIIGPNGGGKTTLIKAILHMVPFSGKITFAPGIDISDGSIGYLPQQTGFDHAFPISVTETVLSGLQSGHKFLRITRQAKEKAQVLMNMTGITKLANKAIGDISGGEMQRALLCRALISDPKLLILDEPANFVDNKFEHELYDILASLSDKMAIVMISHDIGTITSHVKSIVCVNRTVHRHDIAEVTPELLATYNCPIQLITHGEVPHTVLARHDK